MEDQPEEGMDSEDVLVLPTNSHLILLTKRMTDTGTLKAIPAVQSGLTKPTLRK
jgi:hypothetical protein